MIVLVLAGLGLLLLSNVPTDQVPKQDEMPQADSVPVPAGLSLANGHCSGGSAGCSKGIQVFDLEAAPHAGRNPGCLGLDQALETNGWVPTEIEDVDKVGHLRPDGVVGVVCEDSPWPEDNRFHSTVTLVWPGRVEFVSSDP